MTIQLEKHTGVMIKKAARLFEQVANQNLEELGVTYAQTTFLIRLMEKDGQNQMELAKSAGLKQPTVVRILDRMERDGLIKRLRNKDDRRVFNFYLTPKAKKACQKIEGEANRMHHLATKNIPANEVDKLNKWLIQVINNLETFLVNDLG